MPDKPVAAWLIDDVADFLASCPSPEELLAYRPSPQAQARCQVLLNKSKKGVLNAEEEWELNQFEHLELLMQALKARLRRGPNSPPNAGGPRDRIPAAIEPC
jgi:hypothetical protein